MSVVARLRGRYGRALSTSLTMTTCAKTDISSTSSSTDARRLRRCRRRRQQPLVLAVVTPEARPAGRTPVGGGLAARRPRGADQWRARGTGAALSGGRRRPIADAAEPFPPPRPRSRLQVRAAAPTEQLTGHAART